MRPSYWLKKVLSIFQVVHRVPWMSISTIPTFPCFGRDNTSFLRCPTRFLEVCAPFVWTRDNSIQCIRNVLSVRNYKMTWVLLTNNNLFWISYPGKTDFKNLLPREIHYMLLMIVQIIFVILITEYSLRARANYSMHELNVTCGLRWNLDPCFSISN